MFWEFRFRAGNPPVDVAHHVQCNRDILGYFWIWQIICHVVEEIDVPERPSGEILGLGSHLEKLEELKDEILLKVHLCHHLGPVES